MAEDEKAKLERIHERIVEAQERLKLKNSFHDGHQASARELLARYEYLQSQLDKEVADLESQGRHISSLEKSVLNWVNGLRFDR
ncbi:MAG: hypothetical protein COA41_15285 [Sphingopyxis sp.]|nr:MAG: hypothetical protein COA41_15285 [Sphingopyxis sp.]